MNCLFLLNHLSGVVYNKAFSFFFIFQITNIEVEISVLAVREDANEMNLANDIDQAFNSHLPHVSFADRRLHVTFHLVLVEPNLPIRLDYEELVVTLYLQNLVLQSLVHYF